jgi:hypothetical protein
LKNKTKPQSPKQINYVFSHPISFASCATISYPYPPNGFEILGIDATRGGTSPLKEVTFSTFGDENKRILGIRTIEESTGLEKEDLIEFDKEKSLKTFFPKGKYQKQNLLYEKTHLRKVK